MVYIWQSHKTPWVRDSRSCWDLIGQRRGKGKKSFLQVLRTGPQKSCEVCAGVSAWFLQKAARESVHLRAQGLKHNLGQEVIFSLPEVSYCLLLPLALLVKGVRAGLDL